MTRIEGREAPGLDELTGQALRDATPARDVLDLLAHDRRTSHPAPAVHVDGGVAHVRDEVGSEEEGQLVRGLLRRVWGVSAVSNPLRLPGEQPAILDIGAGGTKQVAEALPVGAVPHPGVDLADEPPFEPDWVDHVFAVHVLEHIHELLGLMRRLRRALKPSGVLHVLAPHRRFVNAVADPTHVRFLDVQTFTRFCTGRSGVPPWRPLTAAATVDAVHADLQPWKDLGEGVGRPVMAPWVA